jgi:3-oxoacyl-[acyl-carrier protein] reductase
MIALHGRTALVTGASRGIGRAVALLLARAGADVAIGYRSRAAEAETVAGEVRALGRRAVVAAGDLGDPAAAEGMAAGVAQAFGRLDIFVANAGVWPPDDVPLGDLPLERWRATMTANLDSVFHSTRVALGLMGSGGRWLIRICDTGSSTCCRSCGGASRQRPGAGRNVGSGTAGAEPVA